MNGKGEINISAIVDEIIAISRKERSALRRWDTRSHVRLARRGIDLAEALYRHGSDGRAAVLALTRHDEEIVRLLAATWALKFAPEIAVPVLEALSDWSRRVSKAEWGFDVMTIGRQAEAALQDWRNGVQA